MKHSDNNILYLDCSSGMSGDMLMAALIDAGLDFDAWRAEMKKLPLDPFPKIEFEEVARGGMHAVTFRVIEPEGSAPARTLADMNAILDGSGLSGNVREKTAAALLRLAETEARIHGRSVDEVHFHELSGADTIIDVAGAFMAVEMLGIGRVVCSPINTGSGTVECAHGTLPVPAPATAKLLEGAAIFSRGEGELTTPTGALLATELAASFGDMPEMKLLKVGAGVGTRDYGRPCILRAFFGQAVCEEHASHSSGHTCAHGGKTVYILSTNLDDMEPRVAGYVMDRLLEAGALDVFIEPAYMKKNRPAIVLNVLADAGIIDSLSDIIMRETTTLGIRVLPMRRICMERRIEEVETDFGPVRVKIGKWKGDVVRVNPEYDDCARIARETGRPLADVMNEVKSIALKTFTE